MVFCHYEGAVIWSFLSVVKYVKVVCHTCLSVYMSIFLGSSGLGSDAASSSAAISEESHDKTMGDCKLYFSIISKN